MFSAVAVTYEMDDISSAALELVEKINENLVDCKNKCALLYYDYEMDGAALAVLLEEKLGISVFGCSTIAVIDGETGYNNMCAILTVLSADDCEFTISVTDSLDSETGKEKTFRAVSDAKNKMKSEPKLAFFLPPVAKDIVVDDLLEYASEASGNIPIIGGFPASDIGTNRSLVANGEKITDKLIMMFISGNINPIFSIANVVSTFSDKVCTITKVDGNCIEEVDGNSSIFSFIESFGLDIKKVIEKDDRVFFQKYPLLISDPSLKEYGDLPYVRILSSLNPEDKSGTVFASIPEGAECKLAIMSREDIGVSTQKAVSQLLEAISEQSSDEYKYRTIFCITCAARHFIMNPKYNVEGNTILELLPKEMNLSGFYSYGEISPTSIIGGKATNRVHNGSITFCAI